LNNDKIKTLLLKIADAPMEFSVILSGKKSRKVNGIYKTDTREIILHNRNFTNDINGENLLLYTAIHEYAHHLHACSRGGNLSSRAHTSEFWAIFHELLDKAEKKNIYQNVLTSSPDLEKLTAAIKAKFLEENGNLVKELGKYLLKARDLCEKIGGRFEDYVDRVLRIPKLAAQTAIKMYEYDINPSIGADNMRYVANIRDEDIREGAQKALLSGKSPDAVKTAIKSQQPSALTQTDEDMKERLEKEKSRIEKTIVSLRSRLKEVDTALGKL
jgi:hypothetical protein